MFAEIIYRSPLPNVVSLCGGKKCLSVCRGGRKESIRILDPLLLPLRLLFGPTEFLLFPSKISIHLPTFCFPKDIKKERESERFLECVARWFAFSSAGFVGISVSFN